MSAISEFDIIREYFTHTLLRSDVSLGIGDDCAIAAPPGGQHLAMTIDTLVSGVHFPVNTAPADIAYKSVAVSLSDLAAMGAQPAWLTLALTMPETDESWLRAFAESFYRVCADYDLQLIGGDTTRGALTISVQATGFVRPERVMRRDGAKPGDRIYVTGTLGDAALGLRILTSGEIVAEEIRAACIERLNRPLPRVTFALAAANLCRCAIDISDGLLADLGHITEASGCGADVRFEQVPLSAALKAYFAAHDSQGRQRQSIDPELVLAGGDDYELCLTVSEADEPGLLKLASSMQMPLSCIGRITGGDSVNVILENGDSYVPVRTGYEHFGGERA